MGDRNAEADVTISGEILIPAPTPAFHGASAHISLEKLRAADAPAEILAETVIEGVKHEPGNTDTLVPFTVQVAQNKIAPKYDYAIRVWIDLDSDGKPGPGDRYSDERHSVFFDRLEALITIKVV